MKNRRSYVLYSITVSLCFIVGCAGVHSRRPYSSPHGNFDMPVPESGLGLWDSFLFGDKPARIQESSDDFGGRVVFYRDRGLSCQRSITYRRLPGDLEGTTSTAGEREAQVRSFLHDYALPELFEPVSRDTEILLEEIIWTGNVAECFAVVRIPGGSILTDGAGKRKDSVRALLIFPSGGYMYMLGLASVEWRHIIFPRAETVGVIDPVNYGRRSEDYAVQRLEDDEKLQREFDIFVAQARRWLADFKATIAFR